VWPHGPDRSSGSTQERREPAGRATRATRATKGVDGEVTQPRHPFERSGRARGRRHGEDDVTLGTQRRHHARPVPAEVRSEMGRHNAGEALAGHVDRRLLVPHQGGVERTRHRAQADRQHRSQRQVEAVGDRPAGEAVGEDAGRGAAADEAGPGSRAGDRIAQEATAREAGDLRLEEWLGGDAEERSRWLD
jgi:hypothetical protein